MTSGAGRTLVWSSFNKPTSITGATSTSTFIYGPDRARIQHVITQGATTKTIKYIGSLYEKITETSKPDEHRHYVNAGGRVAYLHHPLGPDDRYTVLTQRPHRLHRCGDR